jgi:hypothetical protein
MCCVGLGAQAEADKNEVVTVAKHCLCYWKAVREGDGEVEHFGANGTEGPFWGLVAGARLKHP